MYIRESASTTTLTPVNDTKPPSIPFCSITSSKGPSWPGAQYFITYLFPLQPSTHYDNNTQNGLVVVLSRRPVPCGFFDNNSRTRSSAAFVYPVSTKQIVQTRDTACVAPFSVRVASFAPELMTLAKDRE